jgi:hypothetical protein
MMYLFLVLLGLALSQVTPLGTPVVVFDGLVYSNSNAAITALDSSTYVVVFESSHLNSTTNTYFQVMDGSTETPTTIGGLFRVNANYAYSEGSAHIASVGNGRFVVVIEADSIGNDAAVLTLWDYNGGTVDQLDSLELESATDDYSAPFVAYLGDDYVVVSYEFDSGLSTRLISVANGELSTVGTNQLIPRPAFIATSGNSYVESSSASKIALGSGMFAVTYGITQNGNSTVLARSSLGGQIYQASSTGLTEVGEPFELLLSQFTTDSCCAATDDSVVVGLGGSLEGYFLTSSWADDVTNNFAVVYLQLWDATPEDGTPIPVGPKLEVSSGSTDYEDSHLIGFGQLPHGMLVFGTEEVDYNIYARLLDIDPVSGVTLNGNRFQINTVDYSYNPAASTLLCDRVAVAWEDDDASSRIMTRLIQIDPLVGANADCQSIDRSDSRSSSPASNIQTLF